MVSRVLILVGIKLAEVERAWGLAHGRLMVWHMSLLLAFHWLGCNPIANCKGHWCGLVCRSLVRQCSVLIIRTPIPKVPTPSDIQSYPLDFFVARHGLVTCEPKSQGVYPTFSSHPTVSGGAWTENGNKKSCSEKREEITQHSLVHGRHREG